MDDQPTGRAINQNVFSSTLDRFDSCSFELLVKIFVDGPTKFWYAHYQTGDRLSAHKRFDPTSRDFYFR